MRSEKIIAALKLLPTSLGSEEVRRTYAADILRRAIFSARMAHAGYLAYLRDVCAQIVAGQMNRADAHLALTRFLGTIGHSPLDGETLVNPASRKRLNLIIDTQRQMAASVAQIEAQTDDTLDDYPGWELKRFVGKGAPREDWHLRWQAAGDAVAWEGAARHTGNFPEWSFIALKSSPIWDALGRGVGGFKDTLGNPYPPFAYSSGLAWDDVERARCERLGLLAPGEAAKSPAAPHLAPNRSDIEEAEARTGFKLSGGLD